MLFDRILKPKGLKKNLKHKKILIFSEFRQSPRVPFDLSTTRLLYQLNPL